MPQADKSQRRMVIDLGNTRLKLGLYEGDTLRHTKTCSGDQFLPEIWEKWKAQWLPERMAICTTASLSPEAEQWLKDNRVVEVGPQLRYPFAIDYKTPETLGQDRLAAVAAVDALYKGTNVLVIDCGTCITYDLLLSDRRYVGGNIAPGIRMRLRSMHDYTDRLPLVELPEEVHWFGQSTTEALQGGGVAMAIMEARGLIFYLIEKYGSLRTVLTGGDAGYFDGHLPGAHEVCVDLVLTGLNEILKNNEV